MLKQLKLGCGHCTEVHDNCLDGVQSHYKICNILFNDGEYFLYLFEVCGDTRGCTSSNEMFDLLTNTKVLPGYRALRR